MSEFEAEQTQAEKEEVSTRSSDVREQPTQPSDIDGRNMMNEVFTSEKPRDALEGLQSGIGNVSKGVIGGVAMLMVAPIQGGIEGAEEGAWGAVKGIGRGLTMGVIGGTATALYGMGTGLAQVGRGVMNSPAAAVAGMEGMDWDEGTRSWVLYDLAADSEAVLDISEETFIERLEAEYRARYDDYVAEMRAAAAAAAAADPTGKEPSDAATDDEGEESEATEVPVKTVKDTDLYDTLGVDPSCSTSELKKAYYKSARASHPDRHPDDPGANAKFQKIADAYNILSNEQTRRAYDEGGYESVSSAEAEMDPRTFFAMVFGTEDFEPLIGELQLAAQFRLGLASVEDLNKASEKAASEKTEKIEKKDDNIPPFSIEGMGLGGDYHRRLMAFLQNQRLVKCAVTLVTTLQPYLDSFSNYTSGDEQGYQMACTEEAMKLASTPLGAILVSLIGNAYIEWAKAETAIVDKVAVGAKQAMRNIYTRASIGFTGAKSIASAIAPTPQQRKSLRSSISSWFGGSAADSSAAEPEAEVKHATDEPDPQSGAAAAAAAAESEATDPAAQVQPLTPEEEAALRQRADYTMANVSIIAWRFVELDIRSSVAKICRKVTHDHSVDDLSRRRRLEALRIRGTAFIQSGRELHDVNEIYTILKTGFADVGMGDPAETAAAEEGDVKVV